MSANGINHSKKKVPEERATGAGFIARAGNNHPCSFTGNESTGVRFRRKGCKRTNARPSHTMHLIIDELFTRIDWRRVSVKIRQNNK